MGWETSMYFLARNKSKTRAMLPLVATSAVAIAIVLLWFFKGESPRTKARHRAPSSLSHPLYSERYPVSQNIREELEYLRSTGKLKLENEKQINENIEIASASLEMPTALLWCLLFQESRFDHLLGIDGDRASHGLGQFTQFSFYEINHQLARYAGDNLNAFLRTVGKDVRPVAPLRANPDDPSSYYSIPTAVAASASYLNNRYKHLGRILYAHDLDYDSDILWMWSALAYNKGTRAVLAIWNEMNLGKDNEKMRRQLNELAAFTAVSRNSALFQQAFSKVWPEPQATAYTKEAVIHLKRVKECAMVADQQSSRKVAAEREVF